jgi:F0F1-type ATP synthase membrane subunit b/b'
MSKNARKSEKSEKTLEERIEAMEKEIDAELDRMAEEVRPKGEHAAVPTGTIRRMWEARAAGNLFHAYLVAKGKYS